MPIRENPFKYVYFHYKTCYVVFFRFNLNAETLRKLVLVHDNLPRVQKDIKTWKLTLESSAKYREGTPQQEEEEDSDDEAELDLSQEEVDLGPNSESVLSDGTEED